ncbi:Tryptophan synthase alpha chain [Labilithrix luteola]|uniref:Tryptophan synthase alpha chain n=1 Tax=Labilithrix luteola TaxID=1391654 RepID=A0A0K1Q624_9BACT|nr:Tryptophan synthase alpha chain [Labilithrix luteola]
MASAIVLLAGLPSCAKAIDIGHQDDDAGLAIEAGPVFVAPSDGAASDAPDLDAGDDVLMCAATDCPAGWMTCLGSDGTIPAYKCATKVTSDPYNCGGCGVQCSRGASAFHMMPVCVDGECAVTCSLGSADCNGIPDDGCESDPRTDPNNCGGCGNKCPAGVECLDGRCGCPDGYTNCGGSCVDLSSDDSNCGQCQLDCKSNQPADAEAPPPHMYYGCKAGQCQDLRCFQDTGQMWTDCNNSIRPDGCEVNVAQPDLKNCGACGNECAQGEKCFSLSATGLACQCRNGTTYCPGVLFVSTETCADLDNDPNNCGSCGYKCPGILNGSPACSHGRCTVKCNEGMADCDGRADNGCEASLKFDARNCGSCGNLCDVGSGQPCVDGICPMQACDAGVTK